jgi:charged multivesicular body protein 2A
MSRLYSHLLLFISHHLRFLPPFQLITLLAEPCTRSINRPNNRPNNNTNISHALISAFTNQYHSVSLCRQQQDLVRTRQYIAKFIEMRSHLQACALKLQTVKSHQAMANALQNTAKAMAKTNKIISVPTITKMMVEFEKENTRSEMMQEMVGDALDDAFANDETEEEEARIVGQVLDEIGISMGDALPAAATTVPVGGQAESVAPSKVATPAGGGDDDDHLTDLEARLNNLKR